jgi:hypothetical protein
MANLLNQECCSQVGGYWTNGTITVVGGQNFQDNVGLSFVNSLNLGLQSYCSNCPTNLQYSGDEVITHPGGMTLTENCCRDYGLTYDTSNSKCYKSCQTTDLQEVYDPNYQPPTPIGPSYDPVEYVIYLKDSNGQDLSTTCCSNLYQTTGEGYVIPDNFYDITSTNFVPNTYRCHKCPPAAGELDYLYIGYQLGVDTITVTGTVYDGIYTELLYMGQSIKTEECCFPRLLTTGTQVKFQNNKCYILPL